ncbi:MAG: site-specific DNA-methyltransferase [Alphaproteobacteria bacterium]|nr:MAG: site-specific DNA-methyltransferase [Alphaproteobacteria bacterium]
MGEVTKIVIGNATLYHGDCLDILPTLSPVSLVVTDPPYLLEQGGMTNAEMSGKFDTRVYDNKGAIVDTPIGWPEIMPAIFRAMETGHAYVMCNNRHVAAALAAAAKSGFRFHNLLVWDKITATPNRWYMKNCEFTCFLFKGKAKYINDCGSQQLVRVPNILNAPHPTQKPVELMKSYIKNSSQVGDVVLDPFMGSGTTGVAALILGRQFIGIEKDKKYFDMACERVENATRQKDLFSLGLEGLPGLSSEREGVG